MRNAHQSKSVAVSGFFELRGARARPQKKKLLGGGGGGGGRKTVTSYKKGLHIQAEKQKKKEV